MSSPTEGTQPGARGVAPSCSGWGCRGWSRLDICSGTGGRDPGGDLEKDRGVSRLSYCSFPGQTACVIWGEGEERAWVVGLGLCPARWSLRASPPSLLLSPCTHTDPLRLPSTALGTPTGTRTQGSAHRSFCALGEMTFLRVLVLSCLTPNPGPSGIC